MEICPCCGSPFSESCGCDCDYYEPPYEPVDWGDKQGKLAIEEILGKIYDLHKNPSHDKNKMKYLLGKYKELTGSDRPRFMLANC